MTLIVKFAAQNPGERVQSRVTDNQWNHMLEVTPRLRLFLVPDTFLTKFWIYRKGPFHSSIKKAVMIECSKTYFLRFS